MPFALPPGRFEDPVPLHRGYQYERKEYIRETVCRFFGKKGLAADTLTVVTRIIDAVQPMNDGQARGNNSFERRVEHYVLMVTFSRFAI